MIDLLDTHAHLDAPELEGTGPGLLPAAKRQGIGRFVIPGVRANDWSALLAMAESTVGIFAAPGLHPAYAGQWSDHVRKQLLALTQHPRVVALGEIGLDGACGPPLADQEKVLRDQLQIALDSRLPVLLHGRKATGRLLGVLREMQIGQNVGGIWHGFSASLQVAEELCDLGFKIGVGPILLRESARKLPEAVVSLPAEALVLETDLPDMADNPASLLKVAETLAELRGWSLEETAQITTANALNVLARLKTLEKD